MDNLVSVWLMPLAGLFVALFTGWKLDPTIAKEEFQSGSRWGNLFPIWIRFIRYVAPVAILLIILHAAGVVKLDQWHF